MATSIANLRRRRRSNMDRSRFPMVVTAALVLATALAANGAGGKGKFGAKLNGASETPPVDTKATGTATLTVSGTSVAYKVTASGLSGNATAAHIHLGSTTAAGPVVVPFPPTDRKSTRLNSSHDQSSYAVFCLKK